MLNRLLDGALLPTPPRVLNSLEAEASGSTQLELSFHSPSGWGVPSALSATVPAPLIRGPEPSLHPTQCSVSVSVSEMFVLF